jgi:hypothetical protein
MVDDIEVGCPYCGEVFTVFADPGEEGQQYIEDCHVCCRPVLLRVSLDEDGVISVETRRDDDA